MTENWIIAIRPKTLFASVAPVILGLAISFVHLRSINVLVAVLTLLCAILLQISTNLANDYIDFQRGVDTEKRLGPIRATQAGLIDIKTMKQAFLISMLLAFIIGLFLMWTGGPFIIFIGLLSLFFAYGYTGGPYPLSHHGLGEIAAFIFFGLFAVCGTVYLQIFHITQLTLILAMGPGFISATILAINNLRDIKTDTESHKKTIAVRFGEKFQRRLCLLLIINSTLVLFFVASIYHFSILFTVSFLPLFFIKNWKHLYTSPIDQSLNQALARTAQYLLIYCLLTSLGLILSTGRIL